MNYTYNVLTLGLQTITIDITDFVNQMPCLELPLLTNQEVVTPDNVMIDSVTISFLSGVYSLEVGVVVTSLESNFIFYISLLCEDSAVLSAVHVTGSVTPQVGVPIVTINDLCKKKCDYQRIVSGTINFTDGFVFLFDEITNKIVASGIVKGNTYTISSSDIKKNTSYILYNVSEGTPQEATTIVTSCDKECVLSGKLEGTTSDIVQGFIVLYQNSTNEAIATGIIINNKWSIKTDLLLANGNYYLKNFKIEQ